MQQECTTMKGQLHQEATYYHQRVHTLACEYQTELNLRPAVTRPEQEWAARLRLEEQQHAVLKTSMQNVEQEVMRTEEDADKILRTETVKYMYEADACQTNLRLYREEVFSTDEGMEILRAGALNLRKLGENAERKL